MNGMKAFVVAVAAITALAGVGRIASAQPDPGAGQEQGMGRGKHAKGDKMRMVSPAERLKRMGERLELTDDQKGKIKPILEEEFKELKALRDNKDLSRAQKRDKLKELREKYHDQIKQILTPEQQKKVDEMREKARERRQEKRERMKDKQEPQK